jgi:DNA repair photolyase
MKTLTQAGVPCNLYLSPIFPLIARMRVPKMVKNGFKSAFCFWATFQSMNCEWPT